MKAGWHTKQLGDICRLIGGGTPSKGKMEYYAGNIPWATVRDMRSEVITETECKITKEAVKSSATNVIPMGNIVIATRVGLGKVCLLGQDTAINQDLRGIVPIDPKISFGAFPFLVAHKHYGLHCGRRHRSNGSGSKTSLRKISPSTCPPARRTAADCRHPGRGV